eukprot:s436_g29.t1
MNNAVMDAKLDLEWAGRLPSPSIWTKGLLEFAIAMAVLSGVCTGGSFEELSEGWTISELSWKGQLEQPELSLRQMHGNKVSAMLIDPRKKGAERCECDEMHVPNVQAGWQLQRLHAMDAISLHSRWCEPVTALESMNKNLICTFQRYDVYRNRGAVFVFGIDKVNQQFSCLRIPRAVQSEEPTPLELSEGEQCYPLAQMQEHRRQLPHLEEVALKASGLVGFIRFTSGFYLILIKKHKKASALECSVLIHFGSVAQ